MEAPARGRFIPYLRYVCGYLNLFHILEMEAPLGAAMIFFFLKTVHAITMVAKIEGNPRLESNGGPTEMVLG
jgi:hypothetical protein